MEASTLSHRIRFGKFELDAESGELSKDGRRVRLQGQPIQILLMLLEKPGRLVTREELQQRLWPKDTFVDFDYGLNAAIKRLRESLGDSADEPLYVETLPRRGYRFIFPVEGKPMELCPVPALSPKWILHLWPSSRPLLRRRWAPILATAAAALIIVSVLIWKWPRPLVEQPSIVVLPFDDISPGHDSEYLAAGLTEEFIGKLSQIRALRVISRTTAIALKGTHKTLSAIAQEVKVRYVLEGSIAKTGNTLRINTKLIDAASDTTLLADQRNGTSEELFDMQEKISRAIVEELKLKVSTAEEQQITRRPITNIQAYDAYLRARNVIRRFIGGKELDDALQYLQDSLKLNGDNALIYAGLAYVYFEYANLGPQQEVAIEKADAYAEKALRLDPETALAHMVEGLLYSTRRGNQREAIRHYKQALSIDPNDSDALYFLLSAYNMSGRTTAAMAVANRMMEIDPLNAFALDGLGWVHFCDGRFEESIEAHRRCFALHDEPAYRFNLAFCLAGAGRFEEVRVLLGPPRETLSTDCFDMSMSFLRLALRGEKEKVPDLVAPFVPTFRRDAMGSWFVAELYALIDEKQQALDWLEKAANLGFINYLYLSQYDPFFAKFHDDPRFQKLMVRVKGEWEQFQE